MNGSTLIGGGAREPQSGTDLAARSEPAISTDDGYSDILWQNTTTGQASIWEMNGNTLIGGGTVSPNPGPLGRRSEPAISITTASPTSFGRTTNTGQVSIWEMHGNKLIGGGQ